MGVYNQRTTTGSMIQSEPCGTSINHLKKGVKSEGTMYVKDTQVIRNPKEESNWKVVEWLRDKSQRQQMLHCANWHKQPFFLQREGLRTTLQHSVRRCWCQWVLQKCELNTQLWLKTFSKSCYGEAITWEEIDNYRVMSFKKPEYSNLESSFGLRTLLFNKDIAELENF